MGLGESPSVQVAPSGGSTVLAGGGGGAPCGGATTGPLLGEPSGQRLSRAADGQLAVLVAATLGETRKRDRHLGVDFPAVAVRVGEVDAALVHVVHRALDAHAVFEQRAVRLSQRL